MNSYGLSVSYCFKLNEEKNSEFFFAVFFCMEKNSEFSPPLTTNIQVLYVDITYFGVQKKCFLCKSFLTHNVKKIHAQGWILGTIKASFLLHQGQPSVKLFCACLFLFVVIYCFLSFFPWMQSEEYNDKYSLIPQPWIMPKNQ